MGYDVLPWPANEDEPCCPHDSDKTEDPDAHDPCCAVILRAFGPDRLAEANGWTRWSHDSPKEAGAIIEVPGGLRWLYGEHGKHSLPPHHGFQTWGEHPGWHGPTLAGCPSCKMLPPKEEAVDA